MLWVNRGAWCRPAKKSPGGERHSREMVMGVLPISYRAKMSVAGVGVVWNDTSWKPASASQAR
jgi:hypothetical protein